MDLGRQHFPLEGTVDDPLFNTTFVVVGLETTGLKAKNDHIIEIGTIKIRGGKTIGTSSSLIDPGMETPDHITSLTGITTVNVETAPRLGTVVTQFLEFTRGSVWVAHNAKFDIEFLRQACTDLGLDWPSPSVVDTLTLARRVLDRSQVSSFKLSQLARYVGSPNRPTHRAFNDTIAAVGVLHYLMKRLAVYEIQTAPELVHHSSTAAPEARAKRRLADEAPHTPGAYVFRSRNDDPLYIGTALDLRRRLLQYFNGTDSRRKITEMVSQTERVEIIECLHGFAAEICEACLISALRPPYNRQRTESTRGWYIVPISPGQPAKISRIITDARSLGPFRTRDTATAIRDRFSAFNDDFTITTAQISTTGADRIADMIAEISVLAEAYRFQHAAVQCDHTAGFIISLGKQQHLSMLTVIPSLQAAFPGGDESWYLAEIRYGRLTGASTAPRGAEMNYIIELMESSAQTVTPDDSLYKGTSIDELSIIWRWLQRPEVRIKPTGDEFSYPRLDARKYLQWAIGAQQARREARREP